MGFEELTLLFVNIQYLVVRRVGNDAVGVCISMEV